MYEKLARETKDNFEERIQKALSQKAPDYATAARLKAECQRDLAELENKYQKDLAEVEQQHQKALTAFDKMHEQLSEQS